MDYEIECPKHNAIFDYRTGEAKRAPACVNLACYLVRLDGNQVPVPYTHLTLPTTGTT